MTQLDRRQALKLFAALGATGLAAACGAPNGSGDDVRVSNDPVRIGLLVPQTGGFKPIGDEITNGFQLYLDLNQSRLGGHPVELVTADEGETPQSGRAAMARLLDPSARLLAVTGVASAAVMVAIRDDVEKAKIPLVGSNASPVTLQSVIYIWRTSYVSDEPGRALGPYVASRYPNARIAVLAPDGLAGRDSVTGFREGHGPGNLLNPILTRDVAKPGSDFFGPYLQQLRGQNPDVVYAAFAGTSAVEFVRQLRAAGLRQPVVGPGSLTEGFALAEQGPAAEGIVTALNYSADLDNIANQVFAAAYRKAHGSSPTTYAMASYDAAQVLDKAIRLAGTDPTPQQVNLALGRVGQVDSPRGPWQFNQPRTPQQKWYLREVRMDGQMLSNVLTTELATLG